MKQSKTLFILLLFFNSILAHAQVGIGTTNPDAASILEISSSNKGVILPRVDFNDLPATLPAGYLVYVTHNAPDGNNAFYFNTGTEWRKMIIGVTAVAPLSVSSGILPELTIPEASATQAGVITSTDYTTFSNKLDDLGGCLLGPLTFTASTSSGSGMNITPGVAPTSPADGDVWVTNNGLYARINGITVGPFSDGTLKSITASAPLVKTGTASDPILGIQAASAVQNGYLNSNDYNSLHLTSGSIPFYNSTGLNQNNSNLFWNNSNLNLGIGTSNPNPSAALEINSTSDGILIPRMTALQRNAISAPATGLLVYQTEGDRGVWFYNGIEWQQMAFIGNNGGITRSYGHLSTYNVPSVSSYNTWTKYILSTVPANSDQLSSYDVTSSLTNSRITVSSPGVYQITGTISLYNATGAIKGQWAIYQGSVLQPETLIGINLGNGASDVISGSFNATLVVTNTGAGGDNYFELYHNDNLSSKAFDVKTITLNITKLN